MFGKSIARDAICRFAAAMRSIPEHRVPILTYHSIDDSGSPISRSAERFRKDIALLQQEGYRGTSLAEAFGEQTDHQPVAITFDDGMQSVADLAAPILREFEFTATVFVVTARVGQSANWLVGPRVKANGLGQAQLMGWDALRQLLAAGWEIGSHSVSHRPLDELDDSQLQRELVDSRTQIRERLGCESESFCIPYGRYDQRVLAAISKAGYRRVVSTAFGLAERSSDQHLLPRIGTSRCPSTATLRAALRGFRWSGDLQRATPPVLVAAEDSHG